MPWLPWKTNRPQKPSLKKHRKIILVLLRLSQRFHGFFNYICVLHLLKYMPKKSLLFLVLTLSFFSRNAFSQNDTTKINTLHTQAWKLRTSNLDTAILLTQQTFELLNKPTVKQLPFKWEQKALVKTYYYLGFFYNLKGENKIPLEYFNKALTMSNNIDYLHGKSQVFAGLGSFYMRRGNYPRALAYFFDALRIDEKRGHKEAILVRLSNIGNIYLSQKNYPKAIEYFAKALKLSEDMNDKKHVAIQLGNIGIVYYHQHNLPKALEYYLKALELGKELGNKNEIAMNLNNIASLYKDEKNYDKAMAYFFEALPIAEEQGDVDIVASVTGNIGLIYEIKKDYKKAESYILKALKIAYEINSLELTNEFELSLSALYNSQGKYQLALEHFKKHQLAKDSVFNAENTEKNVRTEMNYEFDKQQAIQNKEHEKEVIALEADNTIQKQLHLFLLIFIALILIILFFVKRAYDNKKRIASFLESEAKRKEVLLQEVHHRINNNLQVISSLLSLQASSVGDEKLNGYLKQSQNRIQSLSTLHELLYQNDSPLEINMQEYLNKVLDYHRDVLQTKTLDVKVNANIAPVYFTTKLAVPIALVVNELITNSIKYAFNENNSGSIEVSLLRDAQKNDDWTLHFSDSGKGLPVNSEVRKESLGLRLVNIMTKQMGAVLTKTNSPGATFTLLFSTTN